MKKIVFLLIGSIVLSAFFGSCKKEEEDDSTTYEVVDTQTDYGMTFSVDYTMTGTDRGDGTYRYAFDYSEGVFLEGDVQLYQVGDYEDITTSSTQVVDVYYSLKYEEDSLDYVIKNTLEATVPVKNIVAKSYLTKTRLYSASGRLVYYTTISECKKDLGRTIPAASGTVNGELHINMKSDYSYKKVDTKFYGSND